jgi:hypothetical protein
VSAARLLLVFVDGVGLAARGADNPFHAEPTPALRALLGTGLTLESVGGDAGPARLAALDATLGAPGLPQSATGQTALFTGVNAPELMGRHVTGLPGPRLREVLARGNLLSTAVARGLRVTFANAFAEAFLAALERGEARVSVTSCCALDAGLRIRTEADLTVGQAVTWDVCGDLFAARAGVDVEIVEPTLAGRRLAAIAAEHDLTLYETFLTDLAGHRREGFEPTEAVRRLDGLLAGIVDGLGAETTLVLTSDHGNLEDLSSRRHTRNPVPWLTFGPAADELTAVRSLLDVTPALLRALDDGGS